MSASPTPPAGIRLASAPLDPVLGACCIALQDEIAAARREPGWTLDVERGALIGAARGMHIYRLEVRGTVTVAADTPVELAVEGLGEPVPGVVLDAGDFHVVVSLEDDLGASIGRARLQADLSFIARRLHRRLDDTLGRAEGLDVAEMLAGLRQTPAAPGAAGDAHARAVARAAASPLHFVWGPPGTGKTEALARIAAHLLARGERVMVLAVSNVAVDTALLRVAERLGDAPEIAEGRVLRAGRPVLPELVADERLLPRAVVAREEPDLVARVDALRDRRAALLRGLAAAPGDRGALDALGRVRAELGRAMEELRLAEGELVSSARLVATTLAGLVVQDRVWRLAADAVLVDETSMVGTAWALAAALAAGRRLVLLGDPRQLPPVVKAGGAMAERWLATDAFTAAGLPGAPDADGRMTLLDRQYRMAAPIADVVNGLAYDGRLETASDAVRLTALAARGPAPGRHLAGLDTAMAAARAVPDAAGTGSRVNPLSALVALALAAEAIAAGSRVAVVTPYRAQAAVLAAAAPVLGEGFQAATVHRFQGSQQEAVIVDLVDAPPLAGPSMLTGTDPDRARRLLAVACSRAEAKLVLLADRAFVRDRHPRRSPVRDLVDAFDTRGAFAPFAVADALPGVHFAPCWDAAAGPALAGGSSMTLCLPHEAIVDDALRDALARAARRGEVQVRAPNALAERIDGLHGVRVERRVHPLGHLLVAGDVVVVGGWRPGDPAVRVQQPTLARALALALLGDPGA